MSGQKKPTVDQEPCAPEIILLCFGAYDKDFAPISVYTNHIIYDLEYFLFKSCLVSRNKAIDEGFRIQQP